MIHKTRSESGTIRALLCFCDQFKDSLQGFVDAFLTRAAIPADGRPQQNNSLRQMAVAIQHIHSTTERIQKGEGITNMSRNKAKTAATK